MKRTPWILLLAFVLVLFIVGCAPETSTTPIPPIALDTSGAPVSSRVKASAEVMPADEAHLSFVISGLVKEVVVKEGDRIEAGQALLALDMAEQEFAVVAAEEALFSAQVNAQLQRIRNKQYRDGKFIVTSGPREQIVVADSKVEQRQAALETAKASLAQSTLLAPFEGTVVEINVSPGEYVQSSQVVVSLADLNNLQVETTDLSELNVAAISVGQSAKVFVEALNEEYEGKVTAISPISDTIGGDVVFKVTIQLDNQPDDLLWGMSADVEINVESP